MIKRLVTSKASIDPSKLELSEILNVFGYPEPDEFSITELKELNIYEFPLVTPDFKVLTHATDVLSAKKNKIKEIEVVVVKNLTEHDILRLVNLHTRFREKNYQSKYSIYVALTKYLTKNPAGKAYAKTIRGENVRAKVATMVRMSSTSLQELSQVAKVRPNMLKDIDDGRAIFSQELDALKERKKQNSSKPKKEVSKKEPNKNPTQFPLSNFLLNIDGIGILEFRDNLPFELKKVGSDISQDYIFTQHDEFDPNTNEVSSTWYTISSKNSETSIQIVINNPLKLK